MTDSEEEYEVDEYHSVGFAAEVACILAIGCVAGLKGLSKMRRGVRKIKAITSLLLVWVTLYLP